MVKNSGERAPLLQTSTADATLTAGEYGKCKISENFSLFWLMQENRKLRAEPLTSTRQSSETPENVPAGIRKEKLELVRTCVEEIFIK